MQVVNNFLKWSFYTGAFFGFMAVLGVLGVWITVEWLAFLISISE